MRRIDKVLGPMPDEIMEDENYRKRDTYYIKDPFSQKWRIKTREEYIATTGENVPVPTEFLEMDFNSLDQLMDIY